MNVKRYFHLIEHGSGEKWCTNRNDSNNTST